MSMNFSILTNNNAELFGSYINRIVGKTKNIYEYYKKVLSKSHTNKDPSSYSYPNEGPITSESHIRIMDAIISTKDYVLLDSGNTVHTLGLWVLYGLPELVFHDLPKKRSREEIKSVIYIITNLYIKQFWDLVTNNIKNNSDKIDRSQSKSLACLYDDNNFKDFTIKPYDSCLKFMRIPESDILKYETYMMLWFYSYYMEVDSNRNIIVPDKDKNVIDKDDGIEYNMYQMYSVKISESDCDIFMKIQNRDSSSDYSSDSSSDL
jgi:hypothetical protein